jgi:hypothetical protein
VPADQQVVIALEIARFQVAEAVTELLSPEAVVQVAQLGQAEQEALPVCAEEEELAVEEDGGSQHDVGI